jgi:trans-2,3-dihydro-3-hydroxyanthranilate isomerase
MEFFQLDVFADEAYLGNPLAVFPDASSLSAEQMQAIAREMNLSESVFVTGRSGSEYEARIFTPAEELPFAGHPTIGCAWLLLELGAISGDRVTQHTAAGATPLTRVAGDLWFERTGSIGDPDEIDAERVAEALKLTAHDLSLTWDEAGLRPAIADAGVSQLMVPIGDLPTLRNLTSPPPFGDERFMGCYCFTRDGSDIRARGFFQEVGVVEDPATGSAAAGLGLYLDRFVGPVDATIIQGAEIGRRSTIRMRAANGKVSIGGAARLVLKGELQALP